MRAPRRCGCRRGRGGLGCAVGCIAKALSLLPPFHRTRLARLKLERLAAASKRPTPKQPLSPPRRAPRRPPRARRPAAPFRPWPHLAGLKLERLAAAAPQLQYKNVVRRILRAPQPQPRRGRAALTGAAAAHTCRRPER